MKAKSINGQTTDQITESLTLAQADGFQPTLAIVFLSAISEIEKLQQLFSKNKISIFGTTTSGEFSEKGIESQGIVVLLLDIDPAYFHIVLKDHADSSTFDSAKQIGQTGKEKFHNPGFLISGVHLETAGEEIIRGLVDEVGQNATIIGGMSGEPLHFEGVLFTNSRTTTKGQIALILDQDKIEIKGLAVSGWKPIGTEKTITKSEGAWVYTIDDQPAMNVIQKFMGSDIVEGDESETIQRLNTTFPLQVKQKAGNPVMRPTLLFNTEDQSVKLGGTVAEGSVFRFSMPPDFEVIDTVIQSSRDIKEDELPEADALIIFSCIGRYASMGPMISKELDGLQETWNVPMTGFFCLGEFGRVPGGNPAFHGTTCSWVALKEK